MEGKKKRGGAFDYCRYLFLLLYYFSPFSVRARDMYCFDDSSIFLGTFLAALMSNKSHQRRRWLFFLHHGATTLMRTHQRTIIHARVHSCMCWRELFFLFGGERLCLWSTCRPLQHLTGSLVVGSLAYFLHFDCSSLDVYPTTVYPIVATALDDSRNSNSFWTHVLHFSPSFLYSNFSADVMESTVDAGAGPNAQHVIEPAATWVLPASLTVHATNPAASAASFNAVSCAAEVACSTIVGSPLPACFIYIYL